MAKVIAFMSMSLDGFVADANDGVAEVFDWPRLADDGFFRARFSSARVASWLVSAVPNRGSTPGP